MNLRNREITKRPEMDSIINEADVCYVGFVDDGQPYVLPFNFAYRDDQIFLHCDNVGHKLDILAVNPNVCVNFNTGNELFNRNKEVACSWGMKYKSVNVYGKAEYIENYDQKYQIMKDFMLKYAGENFEFSEPSIKNVKVIKIPVERITGKKYGY